MNPMPACLLFNFVNSNFTLELKPNKSLTRIVLNMLTPITNTSSLPSVFKILEEKLPSIYESTCYNYDNLSFAKEVLHTETGHLFEHILLAYLCLEKLALGYEDAEYEGVTMWDWVRDSYGTFNIEINIYRKENNILLAALQKSINLFDIILDDTLPSSMLPLDMSEHKLLL